MDFCNIKLSSGCSSLDTNVIRWTSTEYRETD